MVYINSMSSIENLKWRYACKTFDENKALSKEQLHTLLEAFNLTATSYGLQPIKLVVVTRKETLKELVAHSYNQTQVGQASALLVICTINNIDEAYIRDYFELVKKLRNTPDAILASFREFLIESFSKKSAEEIQLWASKQAYLAMGNILSVCADERIDSCPMEGFVPKEYDRVLQLQEKGLSSVLAIPVGFRDASDMFQSMEKVRRPLNESIVRID